RKRPLLERRLNKPITRWQTASFFWNAFFSSRPSWFIISKLSKVLIRQTGQARFTILAQCAFGAERPVRRLWLCRNHSSPRRTPPGVNLAEERQRLQVVKGDRAGGGATQTGSCATRFNQDTGGKELASVSLHTAPNCSVGLLR